MSFFGVLMTCIIVIFLLFVIFTIMLAVISIKENKPKEQNIEKFEGGIKKALIVYHDSPNHTVRRGVDVIIKKLKQMKYSCFLYVARPDLELNVNDYDAIVLASPTYMGKVVKPITDFVVRHEFKDRRILVFVNGNFINNTKDIEYLVKYIELSNIILTEKCSGNFKELEKTVEKIESKNLKTKGRLKWEQLQNEKRDK